MWLKTGTWEYQMENHVLKSIKGVCQRCVVWVHKHVYMGVYTYIKTPHWQSPHGQPPFSNGLIFRHCYIFPYSYVNPGDQQLHQPDQRPVILVPTTPDTQPPNSSLNSVASHGINGWLSFGLIPSWQSCQSHLIKSPGVAVAQIVQRSSIP